MAVSSMATPDALLGYRLERVLIEDPMSFELSGKAVHAIARETGMPPTAFRACCSS